MASQRTHSRVIAGLVKNRKLLVAENISRPLTDRIKTSIFDLIQDYVKQAEVLDLFAGSGGFGIEALSRGATHCTFVEQDTLALNIIRQNLSNTRFQELSTVIPSWVDDYLHNDTKEYSIIFLDPPFAMDPKKIVQITKQAISRISTEGLLIIRVKSDFGISKLTSQLGAFPVYNKTYGQSTVLFFRNLKNGVFN